jgi:hypothetical protein
VLRLLARRWSLVAVLAALGLSYSTLVVAAVLANPLAFGVGVVFASMLDMLVERRFRPIVALLRRAQFGISHRAFGQIFLLLLLVAITDANREMSRVELLVISLVALAVPVCRIGYLSLLTLAQRRILPPVEVRNVDLPENLHPPALPRILSQHAATRLLALGLLPVLAGAYSVHHNSFRAFGVVVALYVAIVGVASLFLLRHLVLLSRRHTRQEILDGVSAALRAYRPEVVLYFSGSASSVYQIDMWIKTLERMPRPSMILVRQRHAIQNMARTRLPVVCIPSSVDLMNFALPDARIALYVANVGNNIHFLREPRIKHVFIGHGDSDKVASFNPFSKVYDQIWVAGPAGRDRYARARVGVRDEAIVEVGRPQLDVLQRWTGSVPTPTPTRPLTVLYVPTWEGWTDDDFQTSLTAMGPVLVRRLLELPVPIRLIYKPHPLTGTRDRKAARVDEQIRAMIEEATRGQDPVPAELQDRLDAIEELLAQPTLDVAEAELLQEEWHATYHQAHAGRHVVVDGRLPTLFDCFNAADVMIADVSSVVSDFLATGKPLVVANPKGLSEDEFRAEFPSSASAYLLHPDADIAPVIESILNGDPLAEERAKARSYLLGPDEPPAQERWNAAAEALIAAATREWSGEHGAGPRWEEVERRLKDGRAPVGLSLAAPDTGDLSDDEAEPDEANGLEANGLGEEGNGALPTSALGRRGTSDAGDV